MSDEKSVEELETHLGRLGAEAEDIGAAVSTGTRHLFVASVSAVAAAAAAPVGLAIPAAVAVGTATRFAVDAIEKVILRRQRTYEAEYSSRASPSGQPPKPGTEQNHFHAYRTLMNALSDDAAPLIARLVVSYSEEPPDLFFRGVGHVLETLDAVHIGALQQLLTTLNAELVECDRDNKQETQTLRFMLTSMPGDGGEAIRVAPDELWSKGHYSPLEHTSAESWASCLSLMRREQVIGYDEATGLNALPAYRVSRTVLGRLAFIVLG
jgi:hypothetical protein